MTDESASAPRTIRDGEPAVDPSLALADRGHLAVEHAAPTVGAR